MCELVRVVHVLEVPPHVQQRCDAGVLQHVPDQPAELLLFLEQQTCLRGITLIAERKKVFENVLQSTMVLTLQRRPASPRPLRATIARSVIDLETRQMPSVQVSQEQVVRHLNGTSVWFVADHSRA